MKCIIERVEIPMTQMPGETFELEMSPEASILDACFFPIPDQLGGGRLAPCMWVENDADGSPKIKRLFMLAPTNKPFDTVSKDEDKHPLTYAVHIKSISHILEEPSPIASFPGALKGMMLHLYEIVKDQPPEDNGVE